MSASSTRELVAAGSRPAVLVARLRRPPLWLWLAAALAVLTLLPYAYAHIYQPPGRTFMGFFFLGDDANTYLAKMRQGWEGGWLWQNRYTSEPSPPVYFFLYWIALGHLAWLLHLPLLGTFHLARVMGAFLLLWAGWLFVQRFVEGTAACTFAICFMALGLGLGFLLWSLHTPVVFGTKTDALDWRMPELTAFYSILALPHFAWAAAFQAVAAVLTLRAAEKGSLRTGLLAGLAWLGEASIHPQMPILVGAACWAAILLRPVAPRGYLAAAIALAIPAPYVAYSYFAYLGNPEVARWSAQWRNNFAPDVVSLALALAPQLFLAACWLPRMLRRRSRDDLFLLAWLLFLAAILWLPNPAANLRRRFFDGVYMPLVVMAANGLYGVILPRLRSAGPRRLLAFAYVAFSTAPSVFLLVAPMLIASNPEYSVSTPEYHALLWLDGRPSGLVVASPRLGLYVPAYTADTSYVGQYSETYDYLPKGRHVLQLLNGQGDMAAFAQEQHARYVIWSSGDGTTAPPAALGRPAFSEGGVEVFQLY